MKMYHRQITTLVIATFVLLAIPFAFPLHATESNNSALTATLSELHQLNTIANATPLSKGETYLSLKVKLVSTTKTPLTFPLSAIALKTPKGKRCELVGIGNGTNEFSEFNVYLPFSAPWYPFSMTYQSNDGKKLFGMKQKTKTDPPEISLLSNDQVLLLGFVIPAKTSTFTLNIGPAKAVKIGIKAAK